MIWEAYQAKIWAGRLPCRQIWETLVLRKSYNFYQMQSIILPIVVGGSQRSFTASTTIRESHSKITSLTSTSHAKNMLSAKALASTSNSPNKMGMDLLIAASTRPSWSIWYQLSWDRTIWFPTNFKVLIK